MLKIVINQRCRQKFEADSMLPGIQEPALSLLKLSETVVVVALLFYVHGKHLRSCRDGQLTNHTFPGQA